ncbi:hypothetical protein LSAT2_022514, partial [Lamellibrachia satsuma]
LPRCDSVTRKCKHSAGVVAPFGVYLTPPPEITAKTTARHVSALRKHPECSPILLHDVGRRTTHRRSRKK